MNQPLHHSLESMTVTATSRRRRRNQKANNGRVRPRQTILMVTALSALATTSAQEATCPPGHSGWAASVDCKQYFWCSAGASSSMFYSCVDSMAFNTATNECQHATSFECQGQKTPAPTSAAPTDAPGESPGELLEAMTSSILGSGSAIPAPGSATAPTNYPTKLGPPLYYGDFRTSSCLSAAAGSDTTALLGTPAWLTEEHMYQSKEECCQDMFGWAPLDNCLGEDWVETNYVIGSMSPTMSPSMTPTGTPSLMPSVSFMPSSPPTDIHSDVPSNVPSSAPSNVPSLSPSRITMVPTLTPTTYGEYSLLFSIML